MSNTIVQPMKTNSWVKGLIILLLISLPLWLSKHNTYTFKPDTVFTTITGQKVSLTDLHGKPLIITFWATTCPSCVKEIPHLITLHERYHLQGIEIIAIAMTYDPPNSVVNMAQEKKLPYRVVLDIKGDYAKAFGHIWATPTTLLINKNGEITKRILGPFNIEDIQRRIEQLLQDNPKPSLP
jgi:thiol-disulfide isomerase/thioredoxin